MTKVAETAAVERFDDWLRSDFVAINTQLEEAYFDDRTDLIVGRPHLDALKQDLLRVGGERVEAIATVRAMPPGGPLQYRLLGLIGHYLAACKRHEIDLSTAPAARDAAWKLSMRIGCALGVAPRFVFAHQSLFNDAVAGSFRTFTSLPDEKLWIHFNASAVLAHRRAARALRDIPGLGVSNPLAGYLLGDARAALVDVLGFNQRLGEQLDVDRFYFNIRPYFKSYCVGATEYRGANAGDFAAINEIDVLLGLCSLEDPFYQGIVHEKARHVPPGDIEAMRSLGDQPSLLALFIGELDAIGSSRGWRANAAALLDVCKAHRAAYAYHHNRLVKGFLERPASAASSAHPGGVTSSGPPLEEVVGTLKRLLDLRAARAGTGSWSVAPCIERIRTEVRQHAD